MITTINEWKSINENIEQNNTFLVLPENMFIKITGEEVRKNEDSYSEGEIGKTEYIESNVNINKLYKTVKDISNYIDDSITHDSWMVMDNRILCQIMADENNNLVTKEKNPELFDKFEKGEINLYAIEYDFNIEIIYQSEEKYTSKQLANLLGIKDYD